MENKMNEVNAPLEKGEKTQTKLDLKDKPP